MKSAILPEPVQRIRLEGSREKLSGIFHPDRYDGIIIIGLALYGIFFSYLSLFRYNTFQLEFDLAIFNQAFWNTITNGELLTNSLEQGSHFGTHFSPILFTLVPFYALSPNPQILLIAQSILLALGVIPLYLCGREILGKKAGCIIGLVYLLYPSLHGVNLYDFHEVAFLPFLLGMTLWGLVSGRRNILLIFALLSLCVKEDVSLVIIMIGLIGLYLTRNDPLSDRWHYLVIIAISVVILVMFFGVIKPMFAPIGTGLQPGSLTQYLDPAISLSHNNSNRIAYLLMTFLPLLLTPFLAPEMLVISLPSFMEILLSPSPYYYSIRYQYSALVIPVLFFAMIIGLSRLRSWEGKFWKRAFMPLVYLILISTVVCSVVYSPAVWVLLQKGTVNEKGMDDHRLNLDKILSVIPEDASISTQYNLLPQVSNRKQIWIDYRDEADIILFDSAFPMRAADFNDDGKNLDDNFVKILNKNHFSLFVNKKNPGLREKINTALQAIPAAGLSS